MPKKNNPLNLNPLQLRTLTLLQALAKLPDHGRAVDDEPGAIVVKDLPHPHGDHFHLGSYLVLARDATGLQNPAAWVALERKGLIKSMFPMGCIVTAAGMGYDTGIADEILHGSDQ
jgi:hypothetical protein